MLTFAGKISLIIMYKGFITPVEIPRSEVEITHETSILLMGSCFAENIGARLSENKFTCDINPFGILYNPMSIAEALRQILDGRVYDENSPELIEHQGQWHSLMHHGSFSNESRKICVEIINERLRKGGEMIRKSRVVLITFGTSYVYEYRGEGESFVVGNCHKLPERTFMRRRLDVEEIVEDYQSLIGRIAEINPNVHFIFTVSPIRHQRDGLHANQLSKSILLLSIDKLCQLMPDRCTYFPAYEIMMDELRDYRFYADDMMHPSPLAIEHIWKRFTDIFFPLPTKKFLQTWEEIRQALAHRPFRPDSEQYKQFLSQIELRIHRLKEKYPNFDAENELQLCRTRLNK